MKTNNVFFLVLIVLGISGCAIRVDFQVESDYPSHMDFSTYKSYQLVEHENDFPIGVNLTNQQYIETAIQREMMVLGYKQTPDPDLLLAYFVKEKLVEETTYNYQGYYNKWGFPLWKDVMEYEEGTLIVDLIDPENQKVVWHGTVDAKVSGSMTDVEEKINETIRALFERFDEDTQQFQKMSVTD